jgi:hypothetical protein
LKSKPDAAAGVIASAADVSMRQRLRSRGC